jgi:nucleoside-diphosphate-sugar epimerase
VTGQGRNGEALERLQVSGIRTAAASLADAEAMQAVCMKQDVVFHCGALSSPWARAADYFRANVTGTENVLKGCEAAAVSRLVHVSTPSVYFDFTPRLGLSEDAPLPRRGANEYARTKRLAEQRIAAASGRGLPVISIRPRAIFGPGDTTILPRLISRLKSRGLRIIGDGMTVSDVTYVDNVVDALLLCARSGERTLGRTYNISNGEPVQLWGMIRRLALDLGYPAPSGHIPFRLALALAGALEIAFGLLPGRPEPPLTRYAVGVLSVSMTLDISAARRDLEYSPRVELAEGLRRFVAWWKAESK